MQVTLQTLLRYEQDRADRSGFISIQWEKVNKIRLESQLIVIHEVAVEQSGKPISMRFALLLSTPAPRNPSRYNEIYSGRHRVCRTEMLPRPCLGYLQ